ncbi:MAG: HlyD family efflux transporter periplasmic adaptor subunit [Dysgonomonas sp.]|nr:HlyD family efflux transporter periplasmic adaptor subunit [Dysgonomonas sp.]
MKEIFPIEIVEYTNENYWAKRRVTTKAIYISIICFVLLIIILLPVIHIDISSQSRGRIRSLYENNTLQSVVSAEILKINIAENQLVKKGDTLVWLQTNVTDEQMRRIKEKLSENAKFIDDIGKLLTGKAKGLSSPKYIAEYAQYYSKVKEQEVTISKNKYEYDISKGLYEKGVESEFEYEQIENNYKLATSQLISIQNEFNNLWQAERTRLEVENNDLQSELKRLEKSKDQYYIIAPINGNITNYIGVKEGSFISSGQELAQITVGDNLLIECYVSPADIGYIRNGQDVKFQFDAFDYRQWGLIEGCVTEIISDVVDIDGQVFFRVRCSMDKDYLELKNGYRGSLKKGMTLTARFILTERSLGQLLFDKIDNWLNPKIMSYGN